MEGVTSFAQQVQIPMDTNAFSWSPNRSSCGSSWSLCDGTVGTMSDSTSRSSGNSADDALGLPLDLDDVSDFALCEKWLKKSETAEGAGLAGCEEDAEV